jgi:hypothetical protein
VPRCEAGCVTAASRILRFGGLVRDEQQGVEELGRVWSGRKAEAGTGALGWRERGGRRHSGRLRPQDDD